jgi:hypothetical protein
MLKTKRDYEKVYPSLTDVIDLSKKMIREIDYTARHWKSHLKGAGRIWFAATDATFKKEMIDGVERGSGIEAFVFFENRAPGSFQTRKTTASDILGAEASAMEWCIVEWAQMRGPGDILIIVGDNQSVMRCMERGWSRHEEMDASIMKIARLLEFESIIKCDIDTDGNYADIGTRPDESYSASEIEQRLRDTLKCLDDGLYAFRRHRKTLIMRQEATIAEEDEVDLLGHEPADYEDEDEDEAENRKRRRDGPSK